jgi:hypothetical protein
MRCLICKKPGGYVKGVRITVIACGEHAKLCHRLEANYKDRHYGDKDRQRIR